MFGPNSRAIFGDSVSMHHRQKGFEVLMRSLKNAFRTKFNIPADSEIIFLSGSGTMANEAAIKSLPMKFAVMPRGQEFTDRLAGLAASHGKVATFGDRNIGVATVHYDTASSKLNDEGNLYGSMNLVDMISAFPYYMPWGKADIWTTVSSKQLGALPIISVVVMSRKAKKLLQYNGYSCLNLFEHAMYGKMSQTPHTPSIPLMTDFLQSIERFDRSAMVEKIKERREMLEVAVSAQFRMGEGPVFTFRHNVLPQRLIGSYGLYCGSKGPQLFLWSGTDAQYEEFVKDLEKIFKRKKK